MTFIEFIGLIISLLALALISARQAREERKRRQDPELYEKEQQARQHSLQETLREMHIEIENGPAASVEEEEEVEIPEERPKQEPVRKVLTPPRRVQRNYDMAFQLKRFQQVRPIDQRRLTSALQQRHIGRDVLSRDMAADLPVDAYTAPRVAGPSVAKRLLGRLQRPSDMVVLHAIWDRPKGLQ